MVRVFFPFEDYLIGSGDVAQSANAFFTKNADLNLGAQNP